MERLARKILQTPVEIQVGGRSVVCKDVEQHVVSRPILIWFYYMIIPRENEGI